MTLQPYTQPLRLSSSACRLHPSSPITGFCSSCLRERLASLDSSPSTTTAPAALQPDLRRSKSYSARKCGASSSEPRRKSCDVRVRNTLCHLFTIDDEENGPSKAKDVQSKSLVVSGKVENGDQIRVSEVGSAQNATVFNHGEEKTMKEHIEIECQNWKPKTRAGNFFLAASVLTQKLRKWKLNQTTKKPPGADGDSGGDYGFGRRSCDTEPRFSVDVGRISLDDPNPVRFSFDEPRASWDGYMIARTIPRLAPMLSVIENAMIPPLPPPIEEQMNSINEDDTVDCSDSSSSQRQNSFDCSSSGKSSNKKVAVEVDDVVSPIHRMKFVVTDGETNDSGFNCDQLDGNGMKKPGSYRKSWNIFRFMHKLNDSKYGGVDCSEKRNEDSNVKLVRSGSCVSSRSSTIGGVSETRGYVKKGARYSPSNIDNGLLRFHLTPLWTGRKKSRRSRLKNSHSIGRSVM